jgi:hypothetical protein
MTLITSSCHPLIFKHVLSPPTSPLSLQNSQAATPTTNAATPLPSPVTAPAPFFLAFDVEFEDALAVEWTSLPVVDAALVIAALDVASGTAMMEDEPALDVVS